MLITKETDEVLLLLTSAVELLRDWLEEGNVDQSVYAIELIQDLTCTLSDEVDNLFEAGHPELLAIDAKITERMRMFDAIKKRMKNGE